MQSYSILIEKINNQEDLKHLTSKMPLLKVSEYMEQLELLKHQYLAYHTAKYKHLDVTLTNFKLNELLNINNEVLGFKIPIPFKVYENFHQNSHEHFDFVLVQKSFRDRLG